MRKKHVGFLCFRSPDVVEKRGEVDNPFFYLDGWNSSSSSSSSSSPPFQNPTSKRVGNDGYDGPLDENYNNNKNKSKKKKRKKISRQKLLKSKILRSLISLTKPPTKSRKEEVPEVVNMKSGVVLPMFTAFSSTSAPPTVDKPTVEGHQVTEVVEDNTRVRGYTTSFGLLVLVVLTTIIMSGRTLGILWTSLCIFSVTVVMFCKRVVVERFL